MSRLSMSLVCALYLAAGHVLAADPPALPSYRQALEAFQAERPAGKGPKLSAADKATMAAAGQALAQTMPDPGLKVGDEAPAFALSNAKGETVSSEALFADGPVILTFYRGAWCPYCSLQLRGLTQSLPAIEAAGGKLVAITPQTPDKSLEQVEKDGLPFEILSDLDSAVMKAYGLYFEVPPELTDVYKRNFNLDLTEYNGEGRNVLPVPGTYIIDSDGIVRFAYADPDYRQRVEPETLVDALTELQSR